MIFPVRHIDLHWIADEDGQPFVSVRDLAAALTQAAPFASDLDGTSALRVVVEMLNANAPK